MRLVLAITILLVAVAAHATDPLPICGPARQAECDPKLAECLRDHPEETQIAACMRRYKECGDGLRMAPERCKVTADNIKAAPGLGEAPPN